MADEGGAVDEVGVALAEAELELPGSRYEGCCDAWRDEDR